ncbi:MAG: hypothetical protein IT368_16670, partial [Candidatus Hydrogenedentes bacterium]|nr:hypothetical protein [Candidatus Hydrogenedentota bacterium]
MTWNDSSWKSTAAMLAVLLTFAGPLCSAADSLFQPADSLPPSTPWDLEALSIAPSCTWIDQDAPVRSLRYAALPYAGHDTEVFAYYASPATLAGKPTPDVKYPAVV